MDVAIEVDAAIVSKQNLVRKPEPPACLQPLNNFNY